MEKNVYYKDKKIGSAIIYYENGRPVCDFSCQFEADKVYKLFLSSKEGSYPLGVMLHEGGRFKIKKCFDIHKYGINGEKIDFGYIEKRIIGQKASPPLEFSIEEFAPITEPIPTLDHALQSCLEDVTVLSHYYEGSIYLCAPLIKNRPFALAPFFCLTTPIEWGGRTVGVIKLNKENLPVFMNNND